MSANTVNFRPTINSQALELEAQAQRTRIHQSIGELRAQMHEVLDVRRMLRAYILPASAVVAGMSALVGFGLAGVFEPRRARGERVVLPPSSAVVPIRGYR